MGALSLVLVALVTTFVTVESLKHCNGYYYERCSYTQYYSEKYYIACGWWNLDRCPKTRTKSRTAYKTCSYKCPDINGGWSSYGSYGGWSTCSKTCGGGTQYRRRYRHCNNPTKRNNGRACSGNSYNDQTRSCNTRSCAVDGRWGAFSNWSVWSSCDGSCGLGTKTKYRTRTCNSPAPAYGGKQCTGEAQQKITASCNLEPCPINGGWSEYTKWTNYTTCSETCGVGIKTRERSRTCTNPEPKHGGAQCEGDKVEKEESECNMVECPEYCECSVVGDSHYQTFDGEWIHFLGTGQFQMAKTDSTETTCPFSINVINEAASQTKDLPYKRSIEFTIQNVKVTLQPDKKVLVDGARVHLPYETKDKAIEVFLSGRYVRVKTTCNVDIEWDGSKIAEFVVLDTFADKMNGVCGKCDKIKNELQTGEGNETETISHKAFGEQFFLASDSEEESDVADLADVSDAVAAIAAENDYCGFLKTGENKTSPFKECLDSEHMDAEVQYDMCVQDVALLFDEKPEVLKKGVCDNLEAVSLKCAENDFAVEWRKPGFCPIICGDNMVYSDKVSGCPRTCVNKNEEEEEEECELPFTGGCECKEGYILSGTTCVKEEDCGCDSPRGYIPIGDKIMEDDCSESYCCERENGTAVLKKETVKCHANGECTLNSEGDRECRCKDTHKGDGVDECKVKVKDCLNKADGSDYTGKTSTTEHGYTCQAWGSSTPHKHKYSTRYGDQSNYCRNPDRSSRPWCYTTDKAKRWDYCDIPPCVDCIATTDKTGRNYNGRTNTTMSGLTCQKWADNTPHKQRYGKKLGSANNYCRNPDGSNKPWCYTMDPKKRWEYCQISMCEAAEIKECRTDERGMTYNGHKSTTVSGRICQAWGSQTPNKHSFKAYASESNYCRNPDNHKSPWCYTTDPNKRWENCDIPACCKYPFY